MPDHLASLERDLSTLIVEYAGTADTRQPDASAFGRVYVRQADLRALIAELVALRRVAQAAAPLVALPWMLIWNSSGGKWYVEWQTLCGALAIAGFDPEQKETKP